MKPETAGAAGSTATAGAVPSGWEVGTPRFGLVGMSLLAVLVGIITGIGAFLFRELIGLVHNLFFLQTVSFAYDSSLFTPSNPWGAFVTLVPAVGAIAVTFVIAQFAPEAKGHGVPEVMDAIYYNGGRIRPIVAVAKSLASALAIGSGAAVGREGPIIQIGSALGSTLGQLIRMPAGQRITLVAAGAGAGIAATFNTPGRPPLSGGCFSDRSRRSPCRRSTRCQRATRSRAPRSWCSTCCSVRCAALPPRCSSACCISPRICSIRCRAAIRGTSSACCWSAY